MSLLETAYWELGGYFVIPAFMVLFFVVGGFLIGIKELITNILKRMDKKE